MPDPKKQTRIKNILTIAVSLADDVGVALLILLGLHLIGITITWYLILFLVLFFAGYVLLMHRLVLPALGREKATGAEEMIGKEAEVTAALKPEGLVKIKGEYWKAKSLEGDILPGEKVEIVKLSRLTLDVRRKKQG